MMPLTWRVNWANKPKHLSQSEMLGAMRANYEKFTKAPGSLAFEEIRSGTALLEIGFAKVDGPGNTIAFVYQPAQGLDMSACGGACGDYTFDNEETDLSIIDFQNVHGHETGHAIGSDHTIGGWMNATYRFGAPLFGDIDPQLLEHIANGYPALALT